VSAPEHIYCVSDDTAAVGAPGLIHIRLLLPLFCPQVVGKRAPQVATHFEGHLLKASRHDDLLAPPISQSEVVPFLASRSQSNRCGVLVFSEVFELAQREFVVVMEDEKISRDLNRLALSEVEHLKIQFDVLV